MEKVQSKKVIFFPAINDRYLNCFNSIFQDHRNIRTDVILRKGLPVEKIQEFFSSGSSFLDYKETNYSFENVSSFLEDKYDESYVLCRNIFITRTHHDELIKSARFCANKVILFDTSKNKIVIDSFFDRLFALRIKTIKALDAVVYSAYKYIVFFSIIALVLSVAPFLFLLGFLKTASRRKPSILIGKRVHSNQSYIISKGLKELGYLAYSVNLVSHPFSYYTCDFECDYSKKNKYVRFFLLCVLFLKCVLKYDIFLFQNNGESFFVSPMWCGDWQIPLFFQKVELFTIKVLGKKIIFEMRDCTAYNPQLTMNDSARNMCHHCNDSRKTNLCENDYQVKANKQAIKFANKILFSTPDLKRHLPENSEWLPNGFIFNQDNTFFNRQENARISIVHSSTCYQMKGTYIVEKVIKRLKDKYEIDFHVLANMPHTVALKLIKNADFVFGQFNAGSHGNFEIECMSYGKPVIGFINPAFIGIYPRELPIISVDENNIEQSIYDSAVRLIEDEKYRLDVGKKSYNYAKNIHDYSSVSKRLSETIESI